VKPTQKLHQAGQSLWLDNITRELLTTGALRSYIDDLGITGLTSNPTIFDHAFSSSDAYDDAIREAAEEGLAPEHVFFRLAIEDLQGAADLFRPIWDRTNGIDGWVSLEVSPRLAPTARWPRRWTSPDGPAGRTSSSRSPAPPRGSMPSRRRSSPGCR
jgi:transaldolase